MPAKEETVNYLTSNEIDRLFGVIKETRDRAIFRLGYHHGLRPPEIAALEFADYKRRQGMFIDDLWIRRTNGGDGRSEKLDIPVTRALRFWVRKRGNASGPLFPSSRGARISHVAFNNLMEGYCKKAEISQEKTRFDILRYTCVMAILSDPHRSILDIGRKLNTEPETAYAYAKMIAKARAVNTLSAAARSIAIDAGETDGDYYAELVARTKRLEKDDWAGMHFETAYVTETQKAKAPNVGGYVYFVETADGQHVKIGFSTRPRKRFSEFGTLRPSIFAIRLLGSIPGSRKTERLLHEKFADARDNGEWFRKTPELDRLIAALLA
jgi:hypothetical protein